MGTLHEDQCTFFIMPRSVRGRMRNVSDKSCRENQNTHFIFSNILFLSPESMSFMRECGKILWQATDGNMALAQCMQDT